MFKGCHFPSEVILETIRYYLAYKLTHGEIAEIQKERGVTVDHAPINQWVIRSTPILENKVRHQMKSISSSWQMDETDIKIKG
ncbi:IS6 family transposase [Vibrio barjaei]|jgi:transposase-like protein|uniref:IS6 family transposase n=1 Tax=Vibrio barjaei TaxID=1676683 RepID=A0ABW7IM63_9VIBR|nr:IS6 family transposase [Vibrio barjaei]MCG9788215.1 IS6 family transposase [Vibrio mediterranei]MCY9872703.1 IS6 family transposase [Vibrio barjaei]OIN28864.1 hypothetical protein AWH66_2006430 [Vibrio barjaei]